MCMRSALFACSKTKLRYWEWENYKKDKSFQLCNNDPWGTWTFGLSTYERHRGITTHETQLHICTFKHVRRPHARTRTHIGERGEHTHALRREIRDRATIRYPLPFLPYLYPQQTHTYRRERVRGRERPAQNISTHTPLYYEPITWGRTVIACRACFRINCTIWTILSFKM